VALPNRNIITNKLAVQERWIKLYRKIHNLFLKDEFIHKADYLKTVAELNARIAELEGKITSELLLIQLGLNTHFHIAPQAPAGSLPTAPPVPPPYTSGFSPTKPVIHKTTTMDLTDNSLKSLGPATAPLGDGSSIEAQKANITATSDIGT